MEPAATVRSPPPRSASPLKLTVSLPSPLIHKSALNRGSSLSTLMVSPRSVSRAPVSTESDAAGEANVTVVPRGEEMVDRPSARSPSSERLIVWPASAN